MQVKHPDTDDYWLQLFGNTECPDCYTVEEIGNGAAKERSLTDETFVYNEETMFMYDKETMRNYKKAADDGFVRDWPGISFESDGICYTLQDAWYQTTTEGWIENYPPDPDQRIREPVYIMIKVTLKNETDKDRLVYINSNNLIAFPKDLYEQSASFIYQDHVVDPSPDNPYYAKFILGAGESDVYTVGFVGGKGFATYDTIYLHWECRPLLDDCGQHFEWIKLPTLECRNAGDAGA